MDVINVGLYGGKSIFGGKETPLEASVISCDIHENCSFYNNGTCLKVRSLGSGCKFGSVRTVKGFTSRARKYSQFRNEWENHEQYNKLRYPPQKLGVIDGLVVFPYPFIRISKIESGKYVVEEPSLFSNRASYIELEKFNSDLIHRICSYRPQAIMGGEITSYQREKVPLFLAHLQEVLPAVFERFIEAYPRFRSKIDFIGRKALLKTISPGMVYYKSSNYPEFNEEWLWDGEFLVYKKGYVKGFNITKNYEVTEIKIRPTDESEITIASNDQVTKSTVFVD